MTTSKAKLNLFDSSSPEVQKEMNEFAKEYIYFLRTTFADRERVGWAKALLEKDNFYEIIPGEESKLNKGQKFYYQNHGKSILFGIVGESNDKITVAEAHVDFPHVDLRPNFLNEYGDQGCCTLKTHYYGGIKKYLFATTPLIMKVFYVKDGKTVSHTIGLDEADPVFTIPDLLIHLSTMQSERKMREVVKADEMKALACATKAGHAKFTENFAALLEKRTGITQADMPYCEFQMFPAYPAKFVGLDYSMIGGCGQDDGVCAFTAIKALQRLENPQHTAIVSLVAYEETGSNGCSGSQSSFVRNTLSDILFRQGVSERKIPFVLQSSLGIGADVGALYDVNFGSVHDSMNAAVINCGVLVERYTGSAGKSGASEIGCETLEELRKNLNKDWYQIKMLGEVDAGGGGTTAKILSQAMNCDVVDIGVGVMNMHSPFEVVGVADVWAAREVYGALLGRK